MIVIFQHARCMDLLVSEDREVNSQEGNDAITIWQRSAVGAALYFFHTDKPAQRRRHDGADPTTNR